MSEQFYQHPSPDGALGGGNGEMLPPGFLPVQQPVASNGMDIAGQQTPAPVDANAPGKPMSTPLGTPHRPGNQGA